MATIPKEILDKFDAELFFPSLSAYQTPRNGFATYLTASRIEAGDPVTIGSDGLARKIPIKPIEENKMGAFEVEYLKRMMELVEICRDRRFEPIEEEKEMEFKEGQKYRLKKNYFTHEAGKIFTFVRHDDKDPDLGRFRDESGEVAIFKYRFRPETEAEGLLRTFGRQVLAEFRQACEKLRRDYVEGKQNSSGLGLCEICRVVDQHSPTLAMGAFGNWSCKDRCLWGFFTGGKCTPYSYTVKVEASRNARIAELSRWIIAIDEALAIKTKVKKKAEGWVNLCREASGKIAAWGKSVDMDDSDEYDKQLLCSTAEEALRERRDYYLKPGDEWAGDPVFISHEYEVEE